VPEPRPTVVADRRRLPLDDYGRFQARPVECPDPNKMMRELDELAIRLMVSVWPTISPRPQNYTQFSAEGLLVGSDQGC